MSRVSAKRQVTIPKELCEMANIRPGDLVEIFEHEGNVTIVKKQPGISSGVLKHLKGGFAMTDEDSLVDALETNSKSKK